MHLAPASNTKHFHFWHSLGEQHFLSHGNRHNLSAHLLLGQSRSRCGYRTCTSKQHSLESNISSSTDSHNLSIHFGSSTFRCGCGRYTPRQQSLGATYCLQQIYNFSAHLLLGLSRPRRDRYTLASNNPGGATNCFLQTILAINCTCTHNCMDILLRPIQEISTKQQPFHYCVLTNLWIPSSAFVDLLGLGNGLFLNCDFYAFIIIF